jgi:septin family protein
MVEKTITMSYNDYQMISLENETFKKQYENLAQEKMVYLTLAERNTNGYFRSPYVNRMTGQVVEKDELLSRMQAHLDRVQKESGEVESEYKKRIQELEEQLRQASINPVETVSKWWHKLIK